VTLVELVVIVAIVGLLGAVSLEAIQAARESARQLHCSNNLRQIGLATLQFEGVRGHYPTGGWGWKWVPDPLLRSRYGQPGGWIYQLLPYLDAQSIHDLPYVRGDRDEVEAKIHEMLATPCVTFHCPSRGNRKIIPFDVDRIPKLTNLKTPPADVTLTDYVANSGTKFIAFEGPQGVSSSEIESTPWPAITHSDGMLLYHQRIRAADVTAGISNVLWVGEKYLGHDNYDSDQDGGNDQSMYSGESSDIRRISLYGILPESYVFPDMEHISDKGIEKSRSKESKYAFGAAHAFSMNAINADGSTGSLSASINRLVFQRMSRRFASLD